MPSLADSRVGMTHCRVCDSWWAGMLTSHCGACHITTTGLTGFDKHRNAPDRKHPLGSCKTPEEAGLVLSDRAYPAWTIPERVVE